MQIKIDRESNLPIYLQITKQIRQSILDGEIKPGTRLTPERRLAALLGVNRTTIVNAYRELAADGLVAGQVGRGTIVTYRPPETGPAPVAGSWPQLQVRPGSQTSNGEGAERNRPSPLPWAQLLSSTTDIRIDPLLHDANTVSARPDVIRFTTGIPSPELYPIDTISELLNEALHQSGQTLLQHTPTEGYPPLREALADWMASSAAETGVEVKYDPDNVVVVAGSQQGLYLIARTLIEPGDLVAVESPTYLGAAQVFRAAGARLLPIPIDQDGMNVDLLQELLPRRRPKLIYTLPTFQNPSGTVLSMDRRLRLLDLAARYQIPVIEDDPYGALRYDGRPLPTLATIDRAAGRQNVIYLSTMSKMLFPGFRIGWATGPKPVIERLTLIKQIVDLDTNALSQWAVWAFLDRGLLQDHLDLLKQDYPMRRDLMIDTLERQGRGLIAADRPSGGIYIWCRIHENLRVRDLLPEAAREGVAFAPGESFYVDEASGRGRSTIRLNFTLPDEGEIIEGVRRLTDAIHRLAEQVDPDGEHITGRRMLTPIV
ncbi:MAG: PLP-dependent aminotransferase family protein [Chloroflexota bacterium]